MKRIANILLRRSDATSLLSLNLVLLSAVAAAPSAQGGTSQNALIGAWKLFSLEELA